MKEQDQGKGMSKIQLPSMKLHSKWIKITLLSFTDDQYGSSNNEDMRSVENEREKKLIKRKKLF
jgi:hypothetical protein